MAEERRKRRDKDQNRRWKKRPPKMDDAVRKQIDDAENALIDTLGPYPISGLNGFQRRQVHLHFEKSQEYEIKTFRDGDDVTLRVFPVGKLKRLAEQKAQEVLMQGEAEALPAMGSFERFVIHDYLKEREGIKTQSEGEGDDRHISIVPVFGRNLKKAKRRLIR